ncbi:MAG TPA: hypothetical protein VK448_11585 [Dissulfurispiraceae bacterium]|nr:hypothetical protein [Dissulfurispiraceae bacterium]
MMKLMAFCVAALSITFLLAACQKKEEQPVPKVTMQSPMATPSDLAHPARPSEGMPQGQMAAPHGGMSSPKAVQVPDDVKKTWKKVTLVFADKTAKKTKDYTVDINSQFEIQGTDLKVVVGDFLPDFKMTGSNITSGSNDPVNPAVRVEIMEKGQSIFKGWLFAKMPEVHPFESDKYGLILKEGVKK